MEVQIPGADFRYFSLPTSLISPTFSLLKLCKFDKTASSLKAGTVDSMFICISSSWDNGWHVLLQTFIE